MCGLKCGFISVSASCVRVDGCVSASDSESIFLSGKRNTATWSRSVWEWETSNGEDSDATSTDWSVDKSESGGVHCGQSPRDAAAGPTSLHSESERLEGDDQSPA